ncbi:DUF2884 family protein [Kangiella sp. TOML190]|uniref:DUF2884 family protein n=1 Tax=Kangiella sp. TOML190 TaxID=2931351 RepID=UPI002040AA4B|nr:DUF2884 family protein [Kangiella sp. TOML190]
MKLKAMNLLLSTALMLSISGPAAAHEVSCSVDMDYNIDIDEQTIRLSDEEREIVLIDDDADLFIKGQKQSLNAEQRRLLDDYADEIRELLPAIDELAMEATHLALDAVTDVSKLLLNESPAKAEKLKSRVEVITSKVRENISNRHLHPKNLEAYLEDRQFEKEFEAIVEEVVADVLQANIGDIISAAMRGDEETVKAFEQRMESFGEQMEQKYEKKAEVLGERAEELCQLVEKIDEKEESFIQSFNDYKSYQLIKAG